jgi:RimJ/RimL family protein N-acetyltransferase
MHNLRFIPIVAEVESVLAVGADHFAKQVGVRLGEHTDLVRGFVRQSVGAIADAEPDHRQHWGGFLVANWDTAGLIGACRFKGPPRNDGTVEIVYFTLPAHRGKGYATAMVAELIERAAQSDGVSRIIAYTSAEDGASAKVLQRNGLQWVGEVVLPEDGLVWRWQLTPQS